MAYICLHLPIIIHVGKYTSPMDPMGRSLKIRLYLLRIRDFPAAQSQTTLRDGIFRSSNPTKVQFPYHPMDVVCLPTLNLVDFH